MLSAIRDSMKGWIAWAIIGLLIIPFALWGIQEYFGDGGPLVVASVNGEDINQQTYQRAFNNQRDRMRERFGGQYIPEMFDERLKKQAIEDLIEKELLYQQADDEGFIVSGISIKNYIQNIESFQDDGKFSNDQYRRVLEANGQSPTGFESIVERDLLTRQVYLGLVSSAIVTKSDISKLVALEEQTREVSYLQIPSNKFLSE